MLQQVRYCKAKQCKDNPIPCEFRIKYQKCETCNESIVYEAYEHSVSVLETTENKRGIDEDSIICSINLVKVDFFKISCYYLRLQRKLYVQTYCSLSDGRKISH